jgi:hypothetical protein
MSRVLLMKGGKYLSRQILGDRFKVSEWLFFYGPFVQFVE